jgi:hypothetical protein
MHSPRCIGICAALLLGSAAVWLLCSTGPPAPAGSAAALSWCMVLSAAWLRGSASIACALLQASGLHAALPFGCSRPKQLSTPLPPLLLLSAHKADHAAHMAAANSAGGSGTALLLLCASPSASSVTTGGQHTLPLPATPSATACGLLAGRSCSTPAAGSCIGSPCSATASPGVHVVAALGSSLSGAAHSAAAACSCSSAVAALPVSGASARASGKGAATSQPCRCAACAAAGGSGARMLQAPLPARCRVAASSAASTSHRRPPVSAQLRAAWGIAPCSPAV